MCVCASQPPPSITVSVTALGSKEEGRFHECNQAELENNGAGIKITSQQGLRSLTFAEATVLSRKGGLSLVVATVDLHSIVKIALIAPNVVGRNLTF